MCIKSTFWSRASTRSTSIGPSKAPRFSTNGDEGSASRSESGRSSSSKAGISGRSDISFQLTRESRHRRDEMNDAVGDGENGPREEIKVDADGRAQPGQRNHRAKQQQDAVFFRARQAARERQREQPHGHPSTIQRRQR